MALEEILRLLKVALRLWGTLQTVKNIVDPTKPVVDDKQPDRHPVVKQLLRGITLILCKHLDSAPAEGKRELGLGGIMNFVDSITDDYDKCRTTDESSDLVKTWMDATVRTYVDQLGDKWNHTMQKAILDPKHRKTARALIDTYLHGIDADQSVTNRWPSPHPDAPEMTVPNVLKAVVADLEFQDFSSDFQRKAVEAMHYLPFRMYAGYKEMIASLSSYVPPNRATGWSHAPLIAWDTPGRESTYAVQRKRSTVTFSQRDMDLDQLLFAIKKHPDVFENLVKAIKKPK